MVGIEVGLVIEFELSAFMLLFQLRLFAFVLLSLLMLVFIFIFAFVWSASFHVEGLRWIEEAQH